MLDPDLRRAEDVPGRVERDVDLADPPRFTVGERFDPRPGQANAEEREPGRSREVGRRASLGVIAMRMGEERPFDRSPRIDPKATRGAEKTPAIECQKRSAAQINPSSSNSSSCSLPPP